MENERLARTIFQIVSGVTTQKRLDFRSSCRVNFRAIRKNRQWNIDPGGFEQFFASKHGCLAHLALWHAFCDESGR
jgi:hypothetical protein